jgi:dihydrofolate synthase/folylpolyglutamate synthase
MNTRTLAEWLDHLQRAHPRSIELGLERVGEVWRRLAAPRPAPTVITVGGTNGKGSTAAFLEAMALAAGKRVGLYTSPHLLRYNERVRVDGVEVSDEALIAAFARIEAVRGATPLTYFEFGTLAAFWIFSQSALDLAVLEVGLGGRLDAVNLIDADAAIVTTVDLDHQDWLGNDRDSIGREKAGIFRTGRPAVIGTQTPPAGLLLEAERIGPRLLRAGRDFAFELAERKWRWRCATEQLELPSPRLAAPCQIDNAAAAVAAWYALRQALGWDRQAIAAGVGEARLPARLQRLRRAGSAEFVIDVGHNPQAARVLADWLHRDPPRGRTLAVFGALGDKDVAGIVAPLASVVARWYVGGLDGLTSRGLPVDRLIERMRGVDPYCIARHRDIEAALSAVMAEAKAEDRILAFGSFFVAAAALTEAHLRGWREAVEPAGYNHG